MFPADPFDAVLLIAFGGPQGPDDVRPFLQNVLTGRRVPAARVEEVARHYALFGGVSPITELTQRQASGLADRLTAAGRRLPVYVGMRNWHPFLADTLLEMSRAGARRALGFIMAAHGSYSSCEQYRQNVTEARRQLMAAGAPDVEVLYVSSWHDHRHFIATVAAHVQQAHDRLPLDVHGSARLIFTAHSIPRSMAATCRYEAQLQTSCALVARAAALDDWTLVYQSRVGRPEDPWLEPDVCEYLRAERPRGLEGAILCPIGFIADHVEVLYDLGQEAAAVCRELSLPMTRAEAVNDDTLFLDMMTDVVLTTLRRYAGGLPLALGPE